MSMSIVVIGSSSVAEVKENETAVLDNRFPALEITSSNVMTPAPMQYVVDIGVLPETVYEIITSGSVFKKKSLVGFSRLRTLKVSSDLRYLFWSDDGVVKSKYIPLACFSKVAMTTGASGSSSISLESREGANGFVFSFESHSLKGSKYSKTSSEMKQWADALRICMDHARRHFYLDYDLHTMHTEHYLL